MSEFLKHPFKLSYFCPLTLVILPLVVSAAHIKFPKDAASSCTGGGYQRYEHCICGEEFGVKVKRKDVPDGDLDNYFSYWTEKDKQRLYYCRPCSLCDDGIPKLASCWENQNTKCGKRCRNEDEYYNEGTKSCQPMMQGDSPVFVDNRRTSTKHPQATKFLKAEDNTATHPIPDYDVKYTDDVTAQDNTSTANNWESITEGVDMVSSYFTIVIVLSSIMILLVVIALPVLWCYCRKPKQENKESDPMESVAMTSTGNHGITSTTEITSTTQITNET